MADSACGDGRCASGFSFWTDKHKTRTFNKRTLIKIRKKIENAHSSVLKYSLSRKQAWGNERRKEKGMKTVFEKVFQLSKHKTTAKTEIMAGITTFMTMAYILAGRAEDDSKPKNWTEKTRPHAHKGEKSEHSIKES